ncbi:MAG: YbjN domain-containing protein [Treponema sp.]|nr:YbjN domain-containing protein [Treponema sp.]
MSKIVKILLAVLLFGGLFVFPAAAQQPEYTKADLQSLYVEYLRNEGYLPSVDPDGDIKFKVGGDNYYIIVDENDLQFFQIYMGFSLGAVTPEDALNAANLSNRRSKVVKVALSSDGTVASITAELLLDDPKNFIPIFSRAISLMRNAENNFMNQLKETM